MRRGSRFSFRSRTGLARAACEIAFRAVETSALYAGGVAIPRLRRQGLSQNRPSIGFPGCGPIIATNITVSPVTQAMTLPMPSRCGEISGSALPYRVLRSVYRCTFGTPADLVFNQNLVYLGTPADLVWGMAGHRRSWYSTRIGVPWYTCRSGMENGLTIERRCRHLGPTPRCCVSYEPSQPGQDQASRDPHHEGEMPHFASPSDR